MNFQVVLVSEETLALCMQWYHLPPVSAFYHLKIQLTPNLKNELCWLLKYQLNDVKFYPEIIRAKYFSGSLRCLVLCYRTVAGCWWCNRTSKKIPQICIFIFIFITMESVVSAIISIGRFVNYRLLTKYRAAWLIKRLRYWNWINLW